MRNIVLLVVISLSMSVFTNCTFIGIGIGSTLEDVSYEDTVKTHSDLLKLKVGDELKIILKDDTFYSGQYQSATKSQVSNDFDEFTINITHGYNLWTLRSEEIQTILLGERYDHKVEGGIIGLGLDILIIIYMINNISVGLE